jgi:hypothetical protein
MIRLVKLRVEQVVIVDIVAVINLILMKKVMKMNIMTMILI